MRSALVLLVFGTFGAEMIVHELGRLALRGAIKARVKKTTADLRAREHDR